MARERNFYRVVSQIEAIAPPALFEKLKSNAGYWAPELQWLNLTQCINRYVEKSSKDEISIKVYALLCNCTEEEMQKQLENDGY